MVSHEKPWPLSVNVIVVFLERSHLDSRFQCHPQPRHATTQVETTYRVCDPLTVICYTLAGWLLSRVKITV